MIRRCYGAMSASCQGGEAREYRIGVPVAWLCDVCRDVAEAHGMDPRPIAALADVPEWVRLRNLGLLGGKDLTERYGS